MDIRQGLGNSCFGGLGTEGLGKKGIREGGKRRSGERRRWGAEEQREIGVLGRGIGDWVAICLLNEYLGWNVLSAILREGA